MNINQVSNNANTFLALEVSREDQISIEETCINEAKTFSTYFVGLHRAHLEASRPKLAALPSVSLQESPPQLEEKKESIKRKKK